MEPAADTAYFSAIAAGDLAAAGAMVAAQAAKCGYTVGPVYHGTQANFTAFRERPRAKRAEMFSFGFHFTPETKLADCYGPNRIAAYLRLANPLDVERVVYRDTEEGRWLASVAPKARWFPDGGREAVWMRNVLDGLPARRIRPILEEGGFDGLLYSATFAERDLRGDRVLAEGVTYIALAPSQVRLADAIVHHPNGGIVPLSARFGEGEDMRGNLTIEPIQIGLAGLRDQDCPAGESVRV